METKFVVALVLLAAVVSGKRPSPELDLEAGISCTRYGCAPSNVTISWPNCSHYNSTLNYMYLKECTSNLQCNITSDSALKDYQCNAPKHRLADMYPGEICTESLDCVFGECDFAKKVCRG
jgi:hypothetical protein